MGSSLKFIAILAGGASTFGSYSDFGSYLFYFCRSLNFRLNLVGFISSFSSFLGSVVYLPRVGPEDLISYLIYYFTGSAF